MKWGLCVMRQGRILWLLHVTDDSSFWTPHKSEAMPVDMLNMPTVPMPFANSACLMPAPIGV